MKVNYTNLETKGKGVRTVKRVCVLTFGSNALARTILWAIAVHYNRDVVQSFGGNYVEYYHQYSEDAHRSAKITISEDGPRLLVECLHAPLSAEGFMAFAEQLADFVEQKEKEYAPILEVITPIAEQASAMPEIKKECEKLRQWSSALSDETGGANERLDEMNEQIGRLWAKLEQLEGREPRFGWK